MKRIWFLAPVLGASLLAAAPAALADTIRHPVGVFAGLDKITGRIITFDVAIDETVQFGTLQITPRICLSRPQTEAPLTEGFVEIDEIETTKQAKRIFSGWMFAASPGLHGVEHPVYDVWLKDCKGGVEITRAPAAGPDLNAPPPPNATPAPVPVKKPRRTITPRNPDEPSMDGLPSTGDPQLTPPQTDPSAGPSDLGAPVEVGGAPGNADAPKPKKPRPKSRPPQDPNLLPPDRVPSQRRAPLAPMSPEDLPRDSFFR